MDYIIFGMGTGATLVLVGWLLREVGPRVRDRAAAEEVLTGSELVTRMAWARFCGACGMTLLLCGLLLLGVTGIMMVIAPEDGLGGLVLLAAFSACPVLLLAWTALYLRQFGATGIIRPRAKPAPLAPPQVLAVPDETAATAGTPSDAVETPFAEAAAARGGFGRFGNLLRRHGTPPEPATPGPVAGASTTAAEALGDSFVSAAPESVGTANAQATEAVITELEIPREPGSDKRLALDDPLVIAVQTPAQAQAGFLAANLEPGERAPVADDAHAIVNHHEAPPGERLASQGDDQRAAEVAMDALRQRRLKRLQHGDDSS